MQGNYFVGAHRTDSFEGIGANITARSAPLCTTITDPAQNVSVTWTMVASLTAGHEGWIQSGVARRYGESVRHFSQLYDQTTGVSSTNWSYFFPLNENHVYWQEWTPACHCLNSWVDSTLLNHTLFNPYGHWPTPWDMELSGETTYAESDILGSPTSHTNFTNISFETYSDTWVFISCPPYLTSVNSQPARWSINTNGCTGRDVWTQVP